MKAIEDRQKKIAEALAAAERGQVELQTAHGEAQTILNAAREQAKKIVDQAHKREVEIDTRTSVTGTSASTGSGRSWRTGGSRMCRFCWRCPGRDGKGPDQQNVDILKGIRAEVSAN